MYFNEQFDMIMRAIGSNSSASVFDDILNYINHNYASQLKLETLAPLFGYNSSYLGKLFTQKWVFVSIPIWIRYALKSNRAA